MELAALARVLLQRPGARLGGAPALRLRRRQQRVGPAREDSLSAAAGDVVIHARGAGFQPAVPKTALLRQNGERRVAPHLRWDLGLFCVAANLIALHGVDVDSAAFLGVRRSLFPAAEAGAAAGQAWAVDDALTALRLALSAVGRPQPGLNAHWGAARARQGSTSTPCGSKTSCATPWAAGQWAGSRWWTSTT